MTSSEPITAHLGVGGAEFYEALWVLGVVLEVSFLDAARVEADLPPAVEHHLLVHLAVDVAEVDCVEIFQKILKNIL